MSECMAGQSFVWAPVTMVPRDAFSRCAGERSGCSFESAARVPEDQRLVRAGHDAARMAEGEAVHRHQVVEGAQRAVGARRRFGDVLVDDALALAVEASAAVVRDDGDHGLRVRAALLEDEQPAVGEGQGIGGLTGQPGRGGGAPGGAVVRAPRDVDRAFCPGRVAEGVVALDQLAGGEARDPRVPPHRVVRIAVGVRCRRDHRRTPRPTAVVGAKRATRVPPDARIVVGLEGLERAQDAAVGEDEETLAGVLDVPAVGQVPGLGPRRTTVVRPCDEVPDRDETLRHRVVRRLAGRLVDRDDDREQPAVRQLRQGATAQVPAGGQGVHEGTGQHAPGRAVIVAADEARPAVPAFPRRADPVAEHDRTGCQPRDPWLAAMTRRIGRLGLPDRRLRRDLDPAHPSDRRQSGSANRRRTFSVTRDTVPP